MKHLILILLTVVISPEIIFAQTYDALHPPNSYQSKENPYYWKNRKPNADYWQQDVYYKINASLNDSTEIIDAQLELIYTNNSPDTLQYVFFHLYQNAFQPESYYDKLAKENNLKPKYGKYEIQRLGTLIENITTSGRNLNSDDAYTPELIYDNTLVKVKLKFPLLPNSDVRFNIKFKSYYDNGSERRRMKVFTHNGYKHFDGVHWYPRICVYDRKFGWDTQQHLGKEFYGNFGCYDVALTLPNQYIAEATGWLQNENEVLPPDLKSKLLIKNFKDKPFQSKPSEIVKPDGTMKTWKYHAENVHDFAFTADPTYRIGEAWWNNVKCVAMAQEEVASRWQDAAAFTARVIETYSRDIGMYAYPKMVVADARDGMEYPMLTLDGGYSPNYYSLFAHEIGHNWFMGMVGNNETYRAMLDEGFTQFLTAWSCSKLLGDTIKKGVPKSRYVRMFDEPETYLNNRSFNTYLNEAIREEDGFLNTHSDMFNGAVGKGGGYRQVYYKTATMLYNLKYVLGEETFLKAMQFYFERWKICHPYVEDFRQAITDYSHADLNWFFDQWIETDKRIDYAVSCVHKCDSVNYFKIRFKRLELMQMPVDFTVTAKDGKQYDFHIPNTWFVKNTTATVLPKWYGWDNINKTYTADVVIPSGICKVEIDRSNLLADVNKLNNTNKCPVKISFDSRLNNQPDWNNYELFIRPDFWGNGYDGLKAGVHIEGNYYKYKHNFSLTMWYNTGLAQDLTDEGNYKDNYDKFSFNFSYNNPTDNFIKGSDIKLDARWLDGLHLYQATFSLKSRDKNNVLHIGVKSMKRYDEYAAEYLLDPTQWNYGNLNNTIRLGLEHFYKYSAGTGHLQLNAVATALWSDEDYGYVEGIAINKNNAGKFEINTRGYACIGYQNGDLNESSLYLAGANPENMMENKYIRSYGFFPREWAQQGQTTPGHFQHGGGLNLRGYAGYAAPDEVSADNLSYTYRNTTGASASAEIEFDKFIKLQPRLTKNWLHFDTYLFGDAGIMNSNKTTDKLNFTNVRADAGAGICMTIKKFGVLQMVEPLTIRFDMPFYLSNAPAADPENFQFRWLVGIQKSF